jgi:hypothetical protein
MHAELARAGKDGEPVNGWLARRRAGIGMPEPTSA